MTVQTIPNKRAMHHVNLEVRGQLSCRRSVGRRSVGVGLLKLVEVLRRQHGGGDQDGSQKGAAGVDVDMTHPMIEDGLRLSFDPEVEFVIAAWNIVQVEASVAGGDGVQRAAEGDHDRAHVGVDVAEDAFSFIFASGIGDAGVGSLAAGWLPGWIAHHMTRRVPLLEVERDVLLLGCAVAALGLPISCEASAAIGPGAEGNVASQPKPVSAEVSSVHRDLGNRDEFASTVCERLLRSPSWLLTPADGFNLSIGQVVQLAGVLLYPFRVGPHGSGAKHPAHASVHCCLAGNVGVCADGCMGSSALLDLHGEPVCERARDLQFAHAESSGCGSQYGFVVCVLLAGDRPDGLLPSAMGLFSLTALGYPRGPCSRSLLLACYGSDVSSARKSAPRRPFSGLRVLCKETETGKSKAIRKGAHCQN